MATVETDDLSIRCEETGPLTGDVVLLLHGWPEDASTWDGMANFFLGGRLQGHRPSLRRFGQSVVRALHEARGSVLCRRGRAAFSRLSAFPDMTQLAGAQSEPLADLR